MSSGRAIATMPRSWEGAKNGYLDLDEDDFDSNTQPWMHKMQVEVLKPVNWIMSQVSNQVKIYSSFLRLLTPTSARHT